jgi:Pyruvate/2-oxoacid:ferredoxin oxidoreductase gamma subunit
MQRVTGGHMLTEIRIAGFGGQGVILAAAVIGKAAAIFEGGYATMTQASDRKPAAARRARR